MSSQYLSYVILGVLVVVAVSIYGCPSGDQALSAEQLYEMSLNGKTVDEKEQAAVKLCDLGYIHRDKVRELLGNSDVEVVQAACAAGLGAMYDYESMEQLLKLLDDESKLIRSRASKSVTRMLGRDYGFRPSADERTRKEVAKKMSEDWRKMKDSELLANFKRELDEKRRALIED